MPSLLSIAAVSVPFVLTLIALPWWIKRAKKHGFVGKDMNKYGHPEVAELGGLIAVPSAVIGILLYVALQVFVYHTGAHTVILLAAVCSLLIAALIGFADDLLGWKIGLRQSQKVILSALIALPMMVINAGTSTMHVPFIGKVTFGLLYPLVIVPLAIIFSANAFNMLAGYNGLEAGLGIIALSALGGIAWLSGGKLAAVIAACIVTSLIAFILPNWYPARIFPGNAFTYAVGAAIAIVAIVGNIEKYALIVFIPFIIEFLLKARGRFQKESFAQPMSNRSLTQQYQEWYSLPHVALSFLSLCTKKPNERQAVSLLLLFELLCAGAALALFLY